MRILIIDFVHEILIDGLKSLGHLVDYHPEYKREDLIKTIGAYEGLIVRTKTSIDKDVLLNAIKLRFIGRAGAGVDNIDTEYCDIHGIVYFNAGEANADAVGEQTIGMLLALFARIVKADDEVRKRVWDREGNRGMQVKEKTLAIIGYGNTGKAVAKKLKGFEMNVLCYDKYLSDYSDEYAREATMEQIFEKADIITFHVPLTDETHHMVDESFIGSFTKSIYLLNLSRGKVIKLEDLMKTMKSGKVVAVGLDVLENERINELKDEEKKVFDYLIHSDRTVLTPHIGGWTKESYAAISSVLLQKIKHLG